MGLREAHRCLTVVRPRNKIDVLMEAILGYRFLLVLFTIAAVSPCGFPQEKHAATARYDDLVAKLEAGDKNVNFKDLRLAYADSTGGPDTDPQKKAMMVALNSKNFEEALKNADIVLAGDYADMDAHFVEYVANRELHNADRSDFHKFVLQGLLNSITGSGDGKSFETAFQVIEVHEEYVLLRFMGLMPSKQSFAKKNGHSFDVLEAVNPKSNEKVTLYFNIDIEQKHLADALKQ